jgi:hypothetical protein
MTRNPVNRFIVPVLCLLWASHAKAQSSLPLPDSSRVQRTLPIKPTSDFDQRFYYLPNRVANVWGYRVGILVQDKYKVGIGGYYMDEMVDDADVADNHLAVSRTTAIPLHRQQLYLGTLYYEPYLIRRRLWETSVVFETGYGRSISIFTDPNDGSVIDKQNKAFIPAGIGLSLNLKLPPLFGFLPIRWFGINAMAGYRKVLYQEGDNYNYDGAYWSLSGAIFLDRILEDLHYWKGKKESRRK